MLQNKRSESPEQHRATPEQGVCADIKCALHLGGEGTKSHYGHKWNCQRGQKRYSERCALPCIEYSQVPLRKETFAVVYTEFI